MSCRSQPDPHASSREHLVRGGGPDLCFQCHGEQARLIQELPRVHTPVLRGQCVKCHLPHGSPNPHMLARNGNALCLGCHDPKKPALQAAHKKTPAAGECMRCHDPHSGDRPVDGAEVPAPDGSDGPQAVAGRCEAPRRTVEWLASMYSLGKDLP